MKGTNGATALAEPKVAGRRHVVVPEGDGNPKGPKTLVVHPLKLKVFTAQVRGLTDVIVHRMSEKAKHGLLAAQQQDEAKPGRKKHEIRDPFADFKGSLYVLPGAKMPTKKLKIGEAWPFVKNTFGVPAVGFKKGMVYAAQRYGMNRMDTEAAIRVVGELAPLKYTKLLFREDNVKIGPWNARKADLRYRGCFQGWSTELLIEYDEDIIKPETIVNLLNRAGRVAGICEWRASAKENPGTYGCYEVVLRASA